MEPGDVLCDGGNEWFENSIRRAQRVRPLGIIYMAMGISGGEEGARNGPSLMPGGPREGFDIMEPIIIKAAAQHVGQRSLTWGARLTKMLATR